MRDYNFRKYNKSKEQTRRRFISNLGYFPTVPKRAEDKSGKTREDLGIKGEFTPTKYPEGFQI